MGFGAASSTHSSSASSLLFKIETRSFMERGVSLSYLSCFPEEAEHLYPPLTFLHPTGRTQRIEVEDHRGEKGGGGGGGMTVVTIVEVEPVFGT